MILKVLEEIETDGMNYEDRDLLVGELRKIAERELAAWKMDHTEQTYVGNDEDHAAPNT